MKREELNYVITSELKIDEGGHVTLFIDPRTVTGEEYVEAYPIRVKKPLTRDKAINAAEMQAYGLVTPLEVASFGTALSRKYRENQDDPEVKDHDNFINWVKDELTKIGV